MDYIISYMKNNVLLHSFANSSGEACELKEELIMEGVDEIDVDELDIEDPEFDFADFTTNLSMGSFGELEVR